MPEMIYTSPVFGKRRVEGSQQIRWLCPECKQTGVEKWDSREVCIFCKWEKEDA